MKSGLLLYKDEVYLYELVGAQLTMYLPFNNRVSLKDLELIMTSMNGGKESIDEEVVGVTAQGKKILIKLGTLRKSSTNGQKVYNVQYYITFKEKKNQIEKLEVDGLKLKSSTIDQYIMPLLNDTIERKYDDKNLQISQTYSLMERLEKTFENSGDLKVAYIDSELSVHVQEKLGGIVYKPYLFLKFNTKNVFDADILNYVQTVRNTFLFLRGFYAADTIDCSFYKDGREVGDLIIPHLQEKQREEEVDLTIKELPFKNYMKLFELLMNNELPLEFIWSKTSKRTTDMSQVIFRATTLEGLADKESKKAYVEKLKELFDHHKETIDIFITYLANGQHSQKISTDQIIFRIRDVRNKIAHGDIGWDITEINPVDFMVAEILIYLSIYKKIGLNDLQAKRAITELYGFNLTFD